MVSYFLCSDTGSQCRVIVPCHRSADRTIADQVPSTGTVSMVDMNDTIVGHDWAVSWLRGALTRGTVHHAYCLTGPESIGKRTLALAFAQALVCSAPAVADRPCGTCRACRKSVAGSHPDVRVLAPNPPTAAITVEQIRSIVHDAALSPLEARYKVFVIARMNQATSAASNALLKTLEEPPAYVVVILLSERREALLPTIVSRCQVIGLRPLPPHQIEQALVTRWHIPAERAALLARLSHGRLGLAVRLAQDEAAWDARGQHIDALLQLLGAGRVQRLGYAATLAAEEDQVLPTLIDWQSCWRDVWLVQARCGEQIVNRDRAPALRALSTRLPNPQVAAALRAVTRTADLVGRTVNTRLALEVLLLRLPFMNGVME